MIFWFSSLVLFISLKVFHWLILCPVFLLSFPIIRLRDFSSATWPFDTHQLFYGARMFLVVPLSFFPVSFIWLGGFSQGFYSSLQQFPRSAELASKGESNCNNMTLRAEVDSSQSGSYVTTIIQNFTLVSLTSTATSHSVRLSFEATVLSHPTHSITYTWLLLVYAVGKFFRQWELSMFCPLVQEWDLSFLEISLDGVELSFWLDATRLPPL